MYLWKWYDEGLIGRWNVRNSEGKGGWKYNISEPQQSTGPTTKFQNILFLNQLKTNLICIQSKREGNVIRPTKTL